MKIKVKFSSALRAQTNEAETMIEQNGAISNLLDALVNKYGEKFKNRIFDENGKLRKFISIYLNGEDIRFASYLNTKLKEGDEVLILPAVSGG